MINDKSFQPINLADAAIALGALRLNTLPARRYVTGVSQDSRTVTPGSLFFALRGSQVDGHSFVKSAVEQGAIAAVVEQRVDAKVPQLLVPSTRIALGELARYYRAGFDIPLVGVTGSVGKTSTKEMLSHILSESFNPHFSRKNFNNELGLPLELFRLTNSNRVSIMELAMRGANQISYLARIARPTVAIITNIGISHIQNLGSIHAIAAAKAEIIDHLDADGVLILNRDDKFFSFFCDIASNRCRVISFGNHPEADFRINGIHTNDRGSPAFSINGVPIAMLSCTGRHHAINAAACFAAANYLGVRPEMISERLGSFTTPERRGTYSVAKNGALLLDSSYSAAPDSVRSTLDNLADIRRKGKRAVAVLGDMQELGSYSEEAHRYVGRVVSELKVDLLVTVGKDSAFIGKQAGIAGWQHFESGDEAAEFLLHETTGNDAIAVQGSRGLFLEQIIDALENGHRRLQYER